MHERLVSTRAEVRGMFEQSPWSFAASLSLQFLAVGVALSIPMLHVTKLDVKLADVVFLPRIGKPDLPPQPPQKRTVTSSTILTNSSGRTYRVFTAPTKI